VFNTRSLDAAQAPDSWDALLDPAWQGRIALRKPLASGTMRTFIGAMILRAPNVEEGFEWLKRLHVATESYPESPQLMYDRLKRNPELITVWLVPDAVLQRERNGYPFDFVIPVETPVITEGIAIIEGAPHPETARLFYEFVTTAEALAHQAQAYAKMPLRSDIPAEALPEWMRSQPFEPMALDKGLLAEHLDVWMERWEREVYGAP
jgi:iron(III) transport system substrate-binding protein